MYTYLRQTFTTWMGRLGWGTFGFGGLKISGITSKIWRVIDDWSNAEFFLGKIIKDNKMDSFFGPIVSALAHPATSTALLVVGFTLILLAGYRQTKKSDIRGKVGDIILGKKLDPDFAYVSLSYQEATYILICLRIKNQGLATVTIIDWFLDVQFGKSTPIEAKKVPIPKSMRIRRQLADPRNEPEITTPEPLDEKATLRRDTSLEGWILFELPTAEMPDPRGGQFRVRLTDSLSDTHEILKEASPFKETGDIVFPRGH